jgi:hypothetical protein
MDINPYISSVKKIYLAMLTLVMSVVYFSSVEYQREEDRLLLSTVDLLLSAQDLARSFEDLPSLWQRDLQDIYIGAAIDESTKQWRRATEEKPQQGPHQELDDIDVEIASSRIAKNRRLRTIPGRNCHILLLKMIIEDFHLIREFYTYQYPLDFDLSDVYLVNFSENCLIGHGLQRSLILIDSRKDPKIGAWVLGLPDDEFGRIPRHLWMELLHHIQEKQGSFDLMGPNSLKVNADYLSHLPEKLQNYAHFDKSYVVVSQEFVETVILNKAQQFTGEIYSPQDLNKAINDFFKLGHLRAGFYGLQLEHMTFLKLAPIVIFLLTYLLYRRLRVIQSNLDVVTEPWVLAHIDNRLDEILVYFYIVAPVLFAVIVFSLFADVQGIGLVILGRAVNLRLLFEGSVPVLFGDYTTDYFAIFVFVLFVGNVVMLIFIEKYLWEIMQYDKYVRRTKSIP